MKPRRMEDPLQPPRELLESDWLWSRLPQVRRSGGPGGENYRGIVRELFTRMKLKERSEWSAYGSGLASFFDIWVYRDEPAFRRRRYDSAEHSFTGLWVLLCRLAPCYVMGEGEQSWSARSSGRYVPTFASVDRFATREVEELGKRIEERLDTHGLARLRKDDVAPLLPLEYRFRSNLAERRLRIFDALFFWND